MEGIKKGEVIVDDSNPNVTQLTFSSQKIIRILFNGDPVQSISFQIPETIMSIKTSTIVVAILELNMFSRNRYDGGVYLLPKKLDEYIAMIHLKIFSASITKLKDEQIEFLGISKEGPFKSQHYRY
uniref:Putative adenosylhomocysteinase 3 (Trinotate prediction) n=1 Tax=Myxobolus squamalis TaxID=59785 RepID=A0A6B2FZ74_MYXSQ